jgi:hypothetical protein
MRLLHPGHRVAEDALCPILDRALDKTGPPRGFDQSARLSLGHSAGAEPGDHRTARGQVHPAPRSRRQVLRRLRRGPSNRRTGGSEDAHPGAEGERVRGALGRLRSSGVSRPRPRLRKASLVTRARAYVEYYNRARPHRDLDLQPPDPGLDPGAVPGTKVRRRDVLGRTDP